MPGEEREDLEALARVASGERRAMTSIVEHHRDAVFRYARTLCRSEAQAEDVLQDTFIAAMRHADDFRGAGSVRGWLLTIARNRAFTAQRKRSGEPAHFEPLDALGVEAGWGAEDALEVLARKDALRQAMATLDPEDQEILTLRELEGLSGPEAAEVLGLSLAAMKSRLHRARLKLAAALRKGGIDGA